MKSDPKIWPVLLFASFLIASLLSTGSPCSAQPMSLDTPEDSPLWWTLTPDLSPAELRARYRDPAATLNRYQAAVAEGLAEPLSEETTAKLKFYQNFDLDPELTPMWLALNLFAAPLERIGADGIKAELARSEISQKGEELLVQALIQLNATEKALGEEAGPKQIEFQKIILQAKRQGYSEALLDWAFAHEDADLLGSISSRTKAEIEDLLAAMQINAPSAATASALEVLQAGLSPDDWEKLRKYLLNEQMRVRGGAFADFS